MRINEIIQIGNQIRKIRTEKGLTQKEVSKLTGIPYSTYSNYENNNREPSLEQLQKIASALNITIFDIITPNEFNTLIISQSQKILDNLSNHPENWVEEDLMTEKQIPSKESILMQYYNRLNKSGKDKAVERVAELTEIPRYTKEE